ncbi:hypothetical protein NDU88_006800 [Pleurodeles waltl]|uniref:Ig-like domain-containing protein n=1 Tax=Pleurodeles waltl TaxID=8319 RepID=A0AAV7LQ60_PLEWA|nr:hypothetical protein NDU88_006800 [Pleurodeles waltl]
MARTTFFLVFSATLVQFCRPQQLSQPTSVSVSPGGTVQIPCTLSSGYKIVSNRVRWFQQRMGGVPVFVYHYYTSSDQGRGEGIPDRFSVTPDTAGNLWNLVITSVRMEDDADYFCGIWPASEFTQRYRHMRN